jgi:hypothetical protein
MERGIVGGERELGWAEIVVLVGLPSTIKPTEKPPLFEVR